jgi:hypothetical protein
MPLSRCVSSANRGLVKARQFINGHLLTKMGSQGRVASHFYIGHGSIELFNDPVEGLREGMTEADILCTVSMSREFDQLKVKKFSVCESGVQTTMLRRSAMTRWTSSMRCTARCGLCFSTSFFFVVDCKLLLISGWGQLG